LRGTKRTLGTYATVTYIMWITYAQFWMWCTSCG